MLIKRILVDQRSSRHLRKLSLTAALLLGLVSSRCTPIPPDPASIRARIQTVGGSSLQSYENPVTALLNPQPSAVGDVGTNLTSQLSSLNYKIFSIALCNSMTPTSSLTYTLPTGCVMLYTSADTPQSGAWAYPTHSFDPVNLVTPLSTQALDLTDFISEASRSTLTKINLLDPQYFQTYHWGYITWYPLYTIKAQATLNNAITSLRTRSNGQITSQGNWVNGSTILSGFLGASYLSTGVNGTWFKLQQPLTIQASDITQNRQMILDLFFNPAGFIQVGNSTTFSSCTECSITDPTNNWMSVPVLALTPIPHDLYQRIQIETYVAPISGPTETSSIRLEFYSQENDPMQLIYGVHAHTLLTANSPQFVASFPKIAGINTSPSGSLSLVLWDQITPVISSLTRQTTIGASTSATLHCGGVAGGFITQDCPDGSTLSVTFTLTSKSTL